MSPDQRPDRRREAAEELEVRRRVREVTDALMARMPESDVVPTLDRVARAMELMGDPQRTYPVIHLTGTNGKTSTTRMVERSCGRPVCARGGSPPRTSTTRWSASPSTARASTPGISSRCGTTWRPSWPSSTPRASRPAARR